MASSNIIGIPANDADFEEKCVPLFANLICDPNFKRVATSGKNQSGIDLIGTRDRDPHRPVGVQCKLRKKNAKLTEIEVRSDISQALTITPALTEIYVVTTASDDLAYDTLSLTLRQEQLALGRVVDIQIWGWDEMQRRIRRDPDALRAFDPDYSASTGEVLALGAETLETAKAGAATIAVVATQATQITGHLAELLSLTKASDSDERAGIDKLLDQQVDEMRDLLNAGKPKTALAMLERLEAKLTPANSKAIRARVRANIGFAHLRLGDDTKASTLLLEAYELNPTDPKIRANRLLALILADDPAGAFAGAREVLADDPANAAAASWAYQAAANLVDDEDPDALVPKELLTDENVSIHRVGFLRIRGRPEWRLVAAESYRVHPSSGVAARLAAEALLDEAYGAEASKLEPATQGERRSLLEEAIGILRPYWDEVRNYENAAEPSWLMVGLNLATAYRAARDLTGARTVADNLLAIAPADPDVLVAVAHIDILEDHSDRALARLAGLPESPQRSLATVIACADVSDWRGIVNFATSERRAELGPLDQQLFDTLLLRARFEVGDVSDAGAAIQAMLGQWPDSATTLITAADLAYRYKSDLASDLVGQVLRIFEGGASFRDRVMLAEMSLRNGDYETVILALDGYLATDKQSEPLAWLSLAFANSPTRPRTHAFFESLAPEVLALSRYARLAGAAENARGDLAAAERHLRRAVANDATDLRAHLLLQNVLERDDRRLEAAEALEAIDEQAVVGAPLELMRLAMLLRRHGHGERAIALGYQIASTNRDNEQIVASYPGLVFYNERLPEEVALGGTASVGCWFELEGIDVPGVSGLIQDDETPGVTSYAPSHPLSQGVLGKSAGDEVVLEAGIGPERHYRVKEVKHRYIWLLHDITRTHATRFPQSTSMGEMSLREGDIQPVLDVVRRQNEHQQAVLDAYANLAVPLEALAGLNHKSVLMVAELIPNLGGEIRTCVGSKEEREAATRAARNALGRGAALDTFTAWRAYHFDLLPALEAHFGHLVIAQSTIDELLELREHEELNADREYMTLGMEGDQAVRQLHTPEDTARRIAVFDQAIAALKKHCQIMPVDGADDRELAHLLHREVIQNMLDPAFLAREQGLFLLSDDLHLRQLASHYGSGRSGWLQVVAMVLKERGLLTASEYALCVGRLAAWKHNHISLNGETLVDLLTMDHPQAEGYFDAATEYIGGPKAEIISHTVAVGDFMIHVWGTSLPSWKKGSAIDRLLVKLIRNRKGDWREVLDDLIDAIPRLRRQIWGRPDLALRYLRDWIAGHFLDAKPLPRQKPKKR